MGSVQGNIASVFVCARPSAVVEIPTTIAMRTIKPVAVGSNKLLQPAHLVLYRRGIRRLP